MIDTKLLENIGLTESEIKVYFSLLELGESTVGPIYEKAGVADSKIYLILEKLKEKGLVSFIIKNKYRYYQAADPKNLIVLLENREEKIKEQKKELTEKIIPQIELQKTLKSIGNDATVYESYEGVKSAFNLILQNLKEGEEYYVFGLGKNLEKKPVIDFFREYHKKRIEKNIKIKLLSKKVHKELIGKNHVYKDMEIRYTDEILPVGTFIFNGHVMTVNWEEKPVAFIIKSGSNYNYYREFFMHFWNMAEK